MNLKNTQLRYRKLTVPANGEVTVPLNVSTYLRVVSSYRRVIEMEVEGGNRMPVWAGAWVRTDDGDTFSRVRFWNSSAVPVTLEIVFGRGHVGDDSLNIADPMTAAVVIRRSEGIQHTPSVTVPAVGNAAVLLLPASESTDYVEISNAPDNQPIRVGHSTVGGLPESGVRIGPGESRKIYSRAALYAISETDTDAGSIGVTRFFF